MNSGERLTKQPFIIIGVVALSFAVAFLALYALVLQPSMLSDSNGLQTAGPFATPTSHLTTVDPTLTPARDLVGTWKTAFVTKFNIQIYGQDVGYENRTMTWVITKTNNESVVNVEVTFTGLNRELTSDAGYTPDVSPMYLTGTVSGTRLTLTSDASYYSEPVGEFTYTTDNIMGTWHDHWEQLYEQNVYTATNGLALNREE